MHVWVLCPCSGVPGLPTELKPTLHIALIHIEPPIVVVGGEDADELDTGKTL